MFAGCLLARSGEMFQGLPQIGSSINNIPRPARNLNSWLLFEVVLLKSLLQKDSALAPVEKLPL